MEIKIFKWSDKNSFYRSFANRTLSPFVIYFIKTIVSDNTIKKKWIDISIFILHYFKY